MLLQMALQCSYIFNYLLFLLQDKLNKKMQKISNKNIDKKKATEMNASSFKKSESLVLTSSKFTTSQVGA